MRSDHGRQSRTETRVRTATPTAGDRPRRGLLAAAGSTARRRAVAPALALLALALRAEAVSVSPVGIYIDDRGRTGTLTLFNPGSRPEEVAIDFAFGYPQSDSAGTIEVPLSETAPDGEPSALPWLRAFPRRLILEPGQRQVVRIMVQPPAGLDAGEYWARVLVRGRGGQPPIEQQRGDVRVQVEVETVVVVALSYRNGHVHTGLRVTDASARITADTVTATIDLAREGTAAFIGRVRADVIDTNGRTIAGTEDVLAVYRDIRRRLAVPLPAGTTGPLRVRFTLDTRRDDLPTGAALPFDGIQHTVEVR